MYIFAAKLAYFVELTKEKAEYLQFSPFYFCYKNLTTYNAKIFAMAVRKFSILKSAFTKRYRNLYFFVESAAYFIKR